MTFVKNTITYEGVNGEKKHERVYTDDGSKTELDVDTDGDILVHEAVEFEDSTKGLLTLYIPQHRIIDLKADTIEDQ